MHEVLRNELPNCTASRSHREENLKEHEGLVETT
jgi:hypothetical protein